MGFLHYVATCSKLPSSVACECLIGYDTNKYVPAGSVILRTVLNAGACPPMINYRIGKLLIHYTVQRSTFRNDLSSRSESLGHNVKEAMAGNTTSRYPRCAWPLHRCLL